jgi:SAM-dependent methyltransferase
MKGETTMAVIDQHLTRWQSFWGSLDGSPQEVFWDADPGREADDLKNFQDHFDPALPVLDAGCGDGALTRLLANHFDRLIGTELAPAAVERARLAKSPRAISYRVLDLRHPDEAATLHEEIGDTNLYIRGVLQAIEPEQREPAARSIELLLGEAGTLYLKELSPASVTYFADLVARNGMPPTLARAPRPHTISEADLRVLFPPDHFHWIDTGSSYIFTKTVLPSGEVVSVPAIWAVLRRRSSQSRLPGRPARTGEGRGARREVWSPASRRD